MEFLNSGDKVHLVATSGIADPLKIRDSIELIKSWGFVPIVNPQVYESDGYLAGSDSSRLNALQLALDDTASKAVFCVRGGYGATRILDKINFNSFRANPKWIIGFSDITALHSKIQSLGLQSIHGPMPVQFSNPDYSNSIEYLRKLLYGQIEEIKWEAERSSNSGTVEGDIIGGNLSLIADSLGTNSEIDTKGKILFLEEINEDIYRIDRMMTQLQRAGKLSVISGLVVGHFTGIRDTNPPFSESIVEIITQKIPKSIPVAFNFPGGHEHPNYAIVLGGRYLFSVNDNRAKLTFMN